VIGWCRAPISAVTRLRTPVHSSAVEASALRESAGVLEPLEAQDGRCTPQAAVVTRAATLKADEAAFKAYAPKIAVNLIFKD
jgi:hypothetical protein